MTTPNNADEPASIPPSPMQHSSIVTDVVTNFIAGDKYICVRNEHGTEITQIHPVLNEKTYIHTYEEGEDVNLSYNCHCKFKINNKLTRTMQLDVFTYLFGEYNTEPLTLHLMPYNHEILSHMEGPNNHRKFAHGLEPFILFVFPDLPTTVKHNYEYLKTA